MPINISVMMARQRRKVGPVCMQPVQLTTSVVILWPAYLLLAINHQRCRRVNMARGFSVSNRFSLLRYV